MYYTYKENIRQSSEPYGWIFIIEASSAEEANKIACEKTSIYFDGVANGKDDEQHGDRWLRCNDSDGTEEPCVDGKYEPDEYLDEDNEFEFLRLLNLDGCSYELGPYLP